MVVSKFPQPSKGKPKDAPKNSLQVVFEGVAPFIPMVKGILADTLKQSNRVTILGAALVCDMKVTDGQVPGAAIALRSGGDEALFVARDGRAPRWVSIESLLIDPKVFSAPTS